MFLTLMIFVLVACPPLLMCAIFAASWFTFKEDREPHPIYRQSEPPFDPEPPISLNDQEKCCA